MALEVWYPTDIERILAALASAADLRGLEYHEALRDVGLAFGVDLPRPGPWLPRIEARPARIDEPMLLTLEMGDR